MKTLILLSGALLTAPGLFAAFITSQDNIDWYAEQGTKRNGTPITDPIRTDPMSIFTSDEGKWLSLGFTQDPLLGGQVYGIANDGYFLSGTLTVQEKTYGVEKGHYPESLRVIFSGSLIGAADYWVNLLQTPLSCNPGSPNCIATLYNADTSKWEVTGFNSAMYSKVTLVDVSKPLSPKVSEDGFDLDYVSIGTSATPEPSTLGMLGAGMVALGLVRRRSKLN